MIEIKRLLIIYLCLLSIECFSNIDTRSLVDECESHTVECAKRFLDNVLERKSNSSLDEAILYIEQSEGHSALKDNLLGVAYLHKQDRDSLEIAKTHLEKALNQGVKASAQNLAELYFSLDDYVNTLKYLELIDAYKYEFPNYKYINWARLYAQVLYFIKDPNINDKQKALKIFGKIAPYDKSGVSEFFLGASNLNQNQLSDALVHLEKAVSKGNIEAMLLLADHYYIGTVLEKNVELAEKYYLLAAKENSGRAYYNLAMLARGRSDANAMKLYLNESARLGYQEAIDLYNALRTKSKSN